MRDTTLWFAGYNYFEGVKKQGIQFRKTRTKEHHSGSGAGQAY